MHERQQSGVEARQACLRTGGVVSLADRITSQRPVRNVCSVGKLLATMPDDDIAALRQMLAGCMSSTQIYAALTAEGYTVGRGTIGNHRRGDCSCEAGA